MPVFKHDGLELYYEVKGREDAFHTVAFFNGVMASVSSWQYLWPVFEKLGYRVVLHDFKGQLMSSKPEGPYSFAQHAAEAKALFKHLGTGPVHIIGTSYGGEVAMRFAINHPEMVHSISLIDSVSELDPVLTSFVESWKLLCDIGDGEIFFKGMMPSIYGGDFIKKNQKMLAERAKATKAMPPEYLMGQKILYDTFLNDVTMTEELHKIQCPALVLCGEEDILKPPKFSQIMADHIPGAEYITLPHCGHVGIFEKPKELESALLGFVMKHTEVI
ncbi:alpha/beta hydrolase [Ruminococcaceae bacterium OttesenSCG-928-A16]|nr:alpha/beta hydrolase [Ruminococcaceae bacterium OttesenSCG-928-A16]